MLSFFLRPLRVYRPFLCLSLRPFSSLPAVSPSPSSQALAKRESRDLTDPAASAPSTESLLLHIPTSLASLDPLVSSLSATREALAAMKARGQQEKEINQIERQLKKKEKSLQASLNELLSSAVSQQSSFMSSHSLSSRSAALSAPSRGVSLVWEYMNKHSRPTEYSVSMTVRALINEGRFSKISEIYSDAVSPSSRLSLDRVAFNGFLNAFVKFQRPREQVMEMFKEMIARGFEPDSYSFNSLMELSSYSGGLDAQLDTWASMRQHKIRLSPQTFSMIIIGLGKHGEIDAARAVWDHIKQKNISRPLPLYNSYVGVLGRANALEEIQAVVKEMKFNGFSPTNETFSSILGGMFASGHVDAALRLHHSLPHGTLGLYRQSRASYLCLLKYCMDSGAVAMKDMVAIYESGLKDGHLTTTGSNKPYYIDIRRIAFPLIPVVMQTHFNRLYAAYLEKGKDAIPRRGMLIVVGRGLKEKLIQLRGVQMAHAVKSSGLSEEQVRENEIQHGIKSTQDEDIEGQYIDEFPDEEPSEAAKRDPLVYGSFIQRRVMAWLEGQSPALKATAREREVNQYNHSRAASEGQKGRPEAAGDVVAEGGFEDDGDDGAEAAAAEGEAAEAEPLITAPAAPMFSHVLIVPHTALLFWLECHHHVRSHGPVPRLRANQIPWFKENCQRIRTEMQKYDVPRNQQNTQSTMQAKETQAALSKSAPGKHGKSSITAAPVASNIPASNTDSSSPSPTPIVPASSPRYLSRVVDLLTSRPSTTIRIRDIEGDLLTGDQLRQAEEETKRIMRTIKEKEGQAENGDRRTGPIKRAANSSSPPVISVRSHPSPPPSSSSPRPSSPTRLSPAAILAHGRGGVAGWTGGRNAAKMDRREWKGKATKKKTGNKIHKRWD